MTARAALRIGLAMAAIAAVAVPAASTHAVAAPDDAEQELLDTYTPVVAVRSQADDCGDGEPYLPMKVDDVFAVPGVVLRGPDGEMIEQPTLDDLTELAALPDGGVEWHVDLPGNALDPGCDFEQDYDALDTPPVVYGRVTTDSEHPGQIVVQYWFFYIYNDWNDRHEGDWEMMQLLFEADDAEEALAVGPYRAMFAQHEGGEYSPWQGGPLERVDDTHSVVYVAEGSHAAYFSSERWFGKSAQSGFGCDDTRAPIDNVTPTVVPLTGDEPWLAFLGRWGEEQKSFNNGPTGPATKTSWDHPVSWVDDEGRVGAVSVPGGGSFATDSFCAISRGGSVLFLRFMDSPVRVVIAIVVLVVLLVLALRLTTWRRSSIDPIYQRRAMGQTATSAWLFVRRHKMLFVPIGLLLLVAGLLSAVFQGALTEWTEVGDAVDLGGRGSATGGFVVTLVGFVILFPTISLVHLACADIVRRQALGEASTRSTALAAGLRRPLAWLRDAFVRSVIAVLLLSIVLAPVGIYLLSRWCVMAPAALETDHPLRRSSELSRGRRVRCGALATLLTTIALVVPALVATLVLIFTDWSFLFVNVIAGVVTAFVTPLNAVAMALLHGDLQLAEPAPEPELLVDEHV